MEKYLGFIDELYYTNYGDSFVIIYIHMQL